MNNLEVTLGKLKLDNPVLASSGCFGHGFEFAEYTDLGEIGAVVLKTVTLEPRKGNPPPRLKEVASGMLSSIGLQNPGFEVYKNKYMPQAQKVLRPNQIIVSIAGNTIEDYKKMRDLVEETYSTSEIAAIEINTACPNVSHGGAAFCSIPSESYNLIKEIVKTAKFPVIVKINTNFDNTCEVGRMVEEAGADILSTVSTPIGMAIDIYKRKPILGNVKGPISGPAIRPIGISKVWDLYKILNIPIIASGGIYAAEDALEYMMAGASAVAVGSAHFTNPTASVEIVKGVKEFVGSNNITNISDLVGVAHK